jgi:hypothetical protein
MSALDLDLAELLQLSLLLQGRTFGAPGTDGPQAVNSEDGREQSKGESGQDDPP